MPYLFSSLILNLKSSRTRLYDVAAVILCTACFSIILMIFLSVRMGLKTLILDASADSHVIVLGSGADSETISNLTRLDLLAITNSLNTRYGPSIILSPEFFTNKRLDRGDNSVAQLVAVRGVRQDAFVLRKKMRMRNGRMFRPGEREVVIGRQLLEQWPTLGPGSMISLGDSEWTVTGVFETQDTVAESEIWGDLDLLQNAYHRVGVYQSVRVLMPDAMLARDAVQALNSGAFYAGAKGLIQTDYYKDQIDEITSFVDVIAIPSVLILLIATGFSTIQSMHTIVEARIRELSTLRAIGFPAQDLSCGILIQSLTLSVSGAALGITSAMLAFHETRAVILNQTSLNELVFPLVMTANSVMITLAIAACLALIGGGPAAVMAARRSIVGGIRRL